MADSPKTPLMTGVRELLKTPKPETQTPRFAGIRNLIQTPKNTEENEAEETETLVALSDLVKTPDVSISKAKNMLLLLQDSQKLLHLQECHSY
ncbi:hypothetical protein EVAR_67965_1 [Eumeta japonica]|uniref:Uncharacterized protein n=1 Tax=Eumeta variegata TaxID=151549 RepID=A0A4C2A0K2_EUMVA|nr:hypothetical protein EVAR_67965_1 [Eumeta japonica]